MVTVLQQSDSKSPAYTNTLNMETPSSPPLHSVCVLQCRGYTTKSKVVLRFLTSPFPNVLHSRTEMLLGKNKCRCEDVFNVAVGCLTFFPFDPWDVVARWAWPSLMRQHPLQVVVAAVVGAQICTAGEQQWDAEMSGGGYGGLCHMLNETMGAIKLHAEPLGQCAHHLQRRKAHI